MLQHLHRTSALRLRKRMRRAVTFWVDLNLPEKPHGITFTQDTLGNIRRTSSIVHIHYESEERPSLISVFLFVLIVNRSQMFINFEINVTMTWLWQNNKKLFNKPIMVCLHFIDCQRKKCDWYECDITPSAGKKEYVESVP